MLRISTSLFALMVFTAPLLHAQESPKSTATETTKPDVAKPDADPKPEKSITHHSIRMGGAPLNYTATAGTFILRDSKSEPWARIGYTAYMKDGADAASRPITFAFNGGPGVQVGSSIVHPSTIGTSAALHSQL